jgi:hypothetical protein
VYTKTGKIYQNNPMTITYAKWSQIIPNDLKIGIPTILIPKPSKIYPNWYFRFDNMPSGLPVPVELDSLLTFLK